MRIGVLEILGLPVRHPAERLYRTLFTKQFASITPQAISVWCRRRGHNTFYATYVGVGPAHSVLPADLDVLFVATYTQASPLAYALSRLYRRTGTLTVIGGPHAEAFPEDCRRFFDLVVQTCDEALIGDVLSGQFDPGSVLSSAAPFEDVPTVEERMPEIRSAAYYVGGRAPMAFSTIPMLASTGCPYTCDFCIDSRTPYRALPTDRLAVDLRYVTRHAPRAFLMFHDPNFAVKFDQVFDVLEAIPPGSRPPYMFESSLTVLRGDRIARLGRTNCAMAAPGVESWTGYSAKAGVGRASGREKVTRVARHFGLLHEHVPYLQANFIFGLDGDRGREPVELTKHFMDETPFAWPAVNIPMPFGGTPLHASLLAEDRILRPMPFGFYYTPHLVTVLRNYDPVTYYRHLLELYSHATSKTMLAHRLSSTANRKVRLIHRVRTAGTRAAMRGYGEILEQLSADPAFRAFHEGRAAPLPEFYHQRYERMLGRYASLLSRADRTPVLSADGTGD